MFAFTWKYMNATQTLGMTGRTPSPLKRLAAPIGASLLALVATCNTSQAYEDYSGCASCHGDFRGSTSPRGTIFPSDNNHEMHRASTSMATACNLCHSGSSRTPVYIGSSDGTANNQGLGCVGCHVGPGLREHHNIKGVTGCYDCHTPETPVPENVPPPYYGTVDTKVNNPGNTVSVANTNENWSIGDFLGLDNDGNNLYDVADFAITPYRISSAAKEGNNIRITWITAGGRADSVQVSDIAGGTYSNLSPVFFIPGIGRVTTNYLQVNGATNTAQFYRLHYTP
jgi:hypothetical protein